MATEEFGTVTFENGKPVPVDEFDTYEFPDESKKDTQKEQEIDIEVIDDTPAADKGRKPMDESVEEVTDDELEAYDVKVQKRIKKLGRGYHDERRAKEEAIRMREEAIKVAQLAIEENKRLQSQLHEGSKIFIDQGKTSAETDLAIAKKAFKEAYDSGDSDALVEAQQKMSEATLKLDKAKDLRPIEIKEQEFKIPETTQQDSKLNKWLENNTWYGGESAEEDEMTGLAITKHNQLARQFGEKYVGTDEYYQKISDTIQKRFPDYFGSQEELETKPTKTKLQSRAKPAANVVAPATRSVAPQKVQLTTTQVQIAKRLGVPLELYARKVAEQMNGDK